MEPPLPPDWVTAVSKSTGKSYWYNIRTKESTYTRPVAHERPVLAEAGPPAKRMRTEEPHAGGYAYPHAGGPAFPGTYVVTSAAAAPYMVQSSSAAAPYGGAPTSYVVPSAGAAAGSYVVPSASAAPASYVVPSATAPYVIPPSTTAAAPPATVAKSLAVAAKYDEHEDVGLEGRMLSRILHLKNFNNWVKATLVSHFAPKPCERVLDLACGKLGDLHKWRLAGVRHYCGIDISLRGLQDAATRFNDVNAQATAKGTPMAAKLIRADLGDTCLEASGVLAAGETFDAISIQFALHYLFQSEARCLTFFKNIAGRLRPGGVFIGTIPDAAYLVRRARDLPHASDASSSSSADSTTSGKFGNSIFSVKFTADGLARARGALGTNPWGVEYDFFLAESVDHVAEYLVPWELLQRVASTVGLVPLIHDNFHAFYERMSTVPQHRDTLKKMRVFDAAGTMTAEEWEAAGVYRVFAFQMPLPDGRTTLPPSTAKFSDAAKLAITDPLPPWEALLPAGKRTQVVPPGSLGYQQTLSPTQIVDVLGAQAAHASVAASWAT